MPAMSAPFDPQTIEIGPKTKTNAFPWIRPACKIVFGQYLSKTTLFHISKINKQTAATPVNRKDIKYLSFVGYTNK